MQIIRNLDGSYIEASGEELERWKLDPVALVENLIGRELSEPEKEAVRQQADMVAYDEMLRQTGFSLRGTAPVDNPDDINVTSVQLVSRALALGSMVPSPEALMDAVPKEVCKVDPRDWFAAPDISRQSFKGVANRKRRSRRR